MANMDDDSSLRDFITTEEDALLEMDEATHREYCKGVENITNDKIEHRKPTAHDIFRQRERTEEELDREQYRTNKRLGQFLTNKVPSIQRRAVENISALERGGEIKQNDKHYDSDTLAGTNYTSDSSRSVTIGTCASRLDSFSDESVDPPGKKCVGFEDTHIARATVLPAATVKEKQNAKVGTNELPASIMRRKNDQGEQKQKRKRRSDAGQKRAPYKPRTKEPGQTKRPSRRTKDLYADRGYANSEKTQSGGTSIIKIKMAQTAAVKAITPCIYPKPELDESGQQIFRQDVPRIRQMHVVHSEINETTPDGHPPENLKRKKSQLMIVSACKEDQEFLTEALSNPAGLEIVALYGAGGHGLRAIDSYYNERKEKRDKQDTRKRKAG